MHLSVNKVGDIPRSVITWTPPHSNNLHFVSLIVPALSIAFLAAIESLLAARVADELAHVSKANEFRPNQELFGQGIASAIASIFGGMPATGAIARTNVNVRSHGTSRIASMVHALTLLIIILFMAPLFSQIPSAAIAGVLIGTSFRIFNKATMLEIFSSGREKTLIFLVTAISTVSIDLIWGISIGIALYWAFALKAKFL